MQLKNTIKTARTKGTVIKRSKTHLSRSIITGSTGTVTHRISNNQQKAVQKTKEDTSIENVEREKKVVSKQTNKESISITTKHG